MPAYRLVAVLLLGGGIAVLGGLIALPHGGRYPPCDLCLMERWPYYAVLGLLLLAPALEARRLLALSVMALSALCFAVAGGISLYHLGVEQHWWAGPLSCTGPATSLDTVEGLQAQFKGLRVSPCDQAQWSALGVSLAGWNAAAALVLTGLALAGWYAVSKAYAGR